MPTVVVQRITEDRDDLLAAQATLRAVTDRELNPDDPPAPIAELRADLFVTSSLQRHAAWLALVDGEAVGELVVGLEAAPNEHRADVEWLAVHPTHRRQGVADALVRVALDDPDLAGRERLAFWAPVLPDGAGVAYAERLGAEMCLAERCSRVRLADLPHDVVEGWLSEGRSRADGYRLVQWTGRIPEEHVGLLTAVRRAMEDQPIDDSDRAVPTMTEDDIRSFDVAAAAHGHLPVMTVAVAADGEPAGYSALFVNEHRPMLAWQGDTGVLAAHRGHGLGRWLKAENLQQALGAAPGMEVIETYNAESNPWMLDINVAMGFRPHVGYQAWEAPTSTVRDALGR